MTDDPDHAGRAPRPWLVADIGGTNARFGWLADGSEEVQHVRTLPVADSDGPAAAAEAYMGGLRAALGAGWQAPRAGCFAVATAVVGDAVAFTNSGWSFSRSDTQGALGLEALLVLNDFEALALSLPRLQSHQLQAWPGSPAAAEGAARAVIGPGTGLGVAGLVHSAHGWVAVPGEGGHATLAPTDDDESAVLAAVRREYSHVSAERLLSGIGLPVLYRGVASVMGVEAEPLGVEDITERGVSGNCAVCSQTLDTFCALLGSFAGSVALTFGARGGVYIGGGIVPRLGERFFASRFRQRFEAKGRFEDYLRATPTLLITDTLAALTGSAQALAQLTTRARAAPARR